MKTGMRQRRVAALIRREIAKLLNKGLKDPRIGFVSVTGVRMSADLRYANVYVSLYGNDRERKSSLIGLCNSAGWVRREVGKHLHTRHIPEIRFFVDETLDTVYHLEEIFDEIHKDECPIRMQGVGLDAIVDEFRCADSFLLTTHANPDGDAVGSLLGINHFLRALGKTRVICVIDDPVPSVYQSLPGADTIIGCDGEKPEYDVAVLIDVATFDRVGKAAEWIDKGKRVVVLDHHLEQDPEGSIGYIDSSYAAVGEIVVELFEAAGLPLTLEAAHCAYVAQITDTGGYRYSNTNARSHVLAAKMQATGLDIAPICSEVFDLVSAPKFELLRRVLQRMEFAGDGCIAHSHVTSQDVEEVGGKKEDLNGLINYLRNVEGVEVAVLFNALESNLTKVSFRSSKRFNSAEFLAGYGGGGHPSAAGASIERPLAEVQATMLEDLEELLRARL